VSDAILHMKRYTHARECPHMGKSVTHVTSVTRDRHVTQAPGGAIYARIKRTAA